MTACPNVAVRTANGKRPFGWLILAGVLLALAVLPLVGHGCHRDDVDHEPSATPPTYNHR